jgi:hypothetical protein
MSIRCAASFALLYFLSFSQFADAQGNLLLTPRRLVFENGNKTAEINIANTGTDTARYVVSFIEQRMTADGSFEQITEPDSGQHFASRFLRYYPRSVYLGPNEAQTIKFQVRSAELLTPGEYRSHLYFRAIEPESPLGSEPPQDNPNGIAVQIKSIFGISIPIIIRIGEDSSQLELDSLTLHKENDSVTRLSVLFNRSGNFSAYGNLYVDHIDNKGVVTPVCIAKGLSVYSPNRRRKFTTIIDRNIKADLSTGKLIARYTTNDPPEKLIAKKEIVITRQ